MAKILYLTNCSAGIFNQVNIWPTSRFCRSKGFLQTKNCSRNLSHYLCELGHEVDFILNSYPTIQSHELKSFDRRAKLLQSTELHNLFRTLCAGRTVEELRFFSYPNLFMVHALADVVNFNQYKMVILDSRTESISLRKSQWHSIFKSHNVSNEDFFECISKCANIHDILNWIDHPKSNDTERCTGDFKLIYNAEILDQQIRPSLKKMSNLFTILGGINQEEVEKYKYPKFLIDTIEGRDSEKIKQILFSKMPNSNFRYYIDEFIEEELLDRLGLFSEKKTDINKLMKKFPATSIMYSGRPKNDANNLFSLTDNIICLDKNLSEKNFQKYFLGGVRFWNAGYEALSERVDSLVS